MSFLWEYAVCDIVNAVSQSDVLLALESLKKNFGLNPDPMIQWQIPGQKWFPAVYHLLAFYHLYIVFQAAPPFGTHWIGIE